MATMLSESHNRATSETLQSLMISGKRLPREGRRHVEAQIDQLTVPCLAENLIFESTLLPLFALYFVLQGELEATNV